MKVDSLSAATTYAMLDAILAGEDVPGQTEVLHRPEVKGWHRDSEYSWTVRYCRYLDIVDIVDI